MIIEGLLTSQNAEDVINVAPMGPIVEDEFQKFTLRPFQGSTTFQNLLQTRCAVFHIVDHVGIIAEAAIRRLSTLPPWVPAEAISGVVLQDCCRWFELRITNIDTSEQRSVMQAEVVHAGQQRAFRGFNRAKHAVIEASILATRLHLLPREEIDSAMRLLRPAVEKTGSDEETSAFEMLETHMAKFYQQKDAS